MPDLFIESLLMESNNCFGNWVISAIGIKFTKTLYVPK